jgi:hypothetical protein
MHLDASLRWNDQWVREMCAGFKPSLERRAKDGVAKSVCHSAWCSLGIGCSMPLPNRFRQPNKCDRACLTAPQPIKQLVFGENASFQKPRHFFLDRGLVLDRLSPETPLLGARFVVTLFIFFCFTLSRKINFRRIAKCIGNV